jgi:hypothetical protein
MKLLIVDEIGAVAQEYGAVTAQVDGMDIEAATLKVVIPGEGDAPDPVTIAGDWTADELRCLVMTAGELWDNIPRARAGEYLSERQLAMLHKANATYRVDAL